MILGVVGENETCQDKNGFAVSMMITKLSMKPVNFGVD